MNSFSIPFADDDSSRTLSELLLDASRLLLSDIEIASDAEIGAILGTASVDAVYQGTPVWRIIGNSPFSINSSTGVVTVAQALSAGSISLKIGVRGIQPAVYARTFSVAVSGEEDDIAIPSYASMVALGDSVVFGTDASDNAHKWINIVGAACGATVLNQGLSGTVLQNSNDSGGSPKTNNGRDRFVAAMLGANLKEAAFLAYGFNDARYVGAPLTFNVTQYAADFREIMNGLITGGYAATKVHIVSPYYITDTGLSTGSSGFSGQTRLGFEAFVTAAHDIASEFGTLFKDIYAYMLANGGGSLIGPDNIHPQDAGHAVIAAGVLRSASVNSLPKPGISSEADSDSITVTPSAPGSGVVVSYEYELIDGIVLLDSNATGEFTGLDDGDYYVKVRAVFDTGLKSAWTFSDVITVEDASTDFVLDTFTDTNGTAITSHTGELGATWTAQFGYSPATPNVIGNNRMYSQSSTGVYHASGTPPSPDYYVEGVIDVITNFGSNVGIAGRMQSGANTFYFVRWSAGAWDLFRIVAGVTSSVLGTYADAFTSGSRTVTLGMIGTTITVAIDGVERINVTDANISGAGFAGVRFSATQTLTTQRHLNSFRAYTPA